jgi:hypothetical protein
LGTSNSCGAIGFFLQDVIVFAAHPYGSLSLLVVHTARWDSPFFLLYLSIFYFSEAFLKVQQREQYSSSAMIQGLPGLTRGRGCQPQQRALDVVGGGAEEGRAWSI